MRVVVTGAAGFIGSHLTEALLAQGHDVVGIDCFTDYYARELKESNLKGSRTSPRFTFHELDLRTADLAEAFTGADVVVNEAATPGLMLSWADFGAYESCNLFGVHRVIEACREAAVRKLVHASTSSVYGAEATGDEASQTMPISPYGVTKLAAEHLLLAHHRVHDLDVSILRYFSIYGPRQRPDMAYRIFCEHMLRGEEITVYGDGHQSRGNTFVADCVAATIQAITLGRPGSTYNIGGGEEVRLLDAIAILGDALGVEPEIRFEPGRPGDQRRTSAIVTKAESELDWRPVVLPSEGLALEAEWVAELLADT